MKFVKVQNITGDTPKTYLLSAKVETELLSLGPRSS